MGTPETVMTITLGGGSGPPIRGMTSIGGRPVQVATPPPVVKRPEPVRPPAPAQKPPEMAMPAPKPVKTVPAPAVQEAPPETPAVARAPTRGRETAPGSAVADTG